MWWLSAATPSLHFDFSGRKLLIVCLAPLSVALVLVAGIAFRRRGTTVNPYTPEQSQTLVIAGLYRWTRNPMYLGMLLALLAWGLWLACYPAFIALPLFVLGINYSQIIPEEEALTKKFGDAYRAYQHKVRRWI